MGNLVDSAMAPKASAGKAKPAAKRPAEAADDPPAKKGGAGLGQGRKKANALGKDTGGKSQVSLATLLGARTPARTPATEEDCHMADVDAANENGFFARWGEPAPQRRGELAGTYIRNGVQMP